MDEKYWTFYMLDLGLGLTDLGLNGFTDLGLNGFTDLGLLDILSLIKVL